MKIIACIGLVSALLGLGFSLLAGNDLLAGVNTMCIVGLIAALSR